MQVHEIWGDDVEIEIEEDGAPEDQVAVNLDGITDITERDLQQLVSQPALARTTAGRTRNTLLEVLCCFNMLNSR